MHLFYRSDAGGRVRRRLAAALPFLTIAAFAPGASAAGPRVIVKVHQASGVINPYFRLTAAPARL
ncbi:MAG: hypothetical protein ACRDK8_08705, partial [Solirubrobacteraceae bacterium]